MVKDVESAIEPATVAHITLNITRGVSAGSFAGIPQVLLAQVVGHLLGIRDRADIGPRFIQKASHHTGHPMSPAMHWLLAGVFHFEYAAGWGALYAVVAERLGPRRVSPLLGGALLSAIVYSAAFSPLGAATQTGAERSTERRSASETAVHLTAALTFGLVTAYAYRWLRERW